MAAGAAAPGLWLQFRAWRQRPTGTLTAARWQVLLFWTLLVLCAPRLGAGLGWLEWTGAYDSDLYHFGIVRWAKEYPTVPGLANLHAPLGFSSTYLLYAAVVDHGLWYRQSAWVVPGVFIVLFAAQLLWTLLCDHAALRRTKIFSLLLLAFAALLICDTCPSLYYDRPAALFLCLALLELALVRRHRRVAVDALGRITLDASRRRRAGAHGPAAGAAELDVAGKNRLVADRPSA